MTTTLLLLPNLSYYQITSHYLSAYFPYVPTFLKKDRSYDTKAVVGKKSPMLSENKPS